MVWAIHDRISLVQNQILSVLPKMETITQNLLFPIPDYIYRMFKKRLAGVDLFRGIAAYMVILLHSRNEAIVAPGFWTTQVLIFASFAVPFFFAASFYFTVERLSRTGEPIALKDKVYRLIIPYGFWSLVYVLARSFIYFKSGDTSGLTSLAQSYLSIIFTGSAAVHLYFLPILLVGLCLAKLLEALVIQRKSIKLLSILLFISLLLYSGLIHSGNGYKVGRFAFASLLENMPSVFQNNPLVQFPLTFFAWGIQCFPYVMMAMVLTHSKVHSTIVTPHYKRARLLGIIGLFLILPFIQTMPPGLDELSMGYIALILAIQLSYHLPENVVLFNLGLCSFGIYLSHHLFVEILEIGLAKINPIFLEKGSLAAVLTIATMSFLLGWMLTYGYQRIKRSS